MTRTGTSAGLAVMVSGFVLASVGGGPLRRAGAAAAAAVLALAVLALGLAVLPRPRPAAPAPQVATAVAPVTRGTVTQRIQIAGVLGFAGTYPVAHQGQAGILTAAAQPGALVRRGGVLYRVDNQPVRLLFGTLPAYRDFAAGMPDGPDIHQLEQNLAALGLDPGRVDQRFTGATAAAIRRWQARWGLPAWQRTGALPLGTMVFAPAALRIAQVPAAVGTSVAPTRRCSRRPRRAGSSPRNSRPTGRAWSTRATKSR
jgi:Putative peptidoglycan binding domain